MSVNFNIVLPVEAVPDCLSSNADGAESDVLCYYNFSAGDYEGLNSYLSAVNWQEIFQDNTDIDKCWELFINVLDKGIELFVPVKVFDPKLTKKDKKLLPLFIRQLYRKKNAAWRLYRNHRTDALCAK